MPGLARKVLITAAVEGLILQPLSSKREQRPAAPVKLKYGDASISNVTRDDSPNPSSKSNASFESFGIVGQWHTHIYWEDRLEREKTNIRRDDRYMSTALANTNNGSSRFQA